MLQWWKETRVNHIWFRCSTPKTFEKKHYTPQNKNMLHLKKGWVSIQGLQGCHGSGSMFNFGRVHSRKLTWIPKMMVWKRWFLLNMAIFGIYVKFWEGSFYPPCYPLEPSGDKGPSRLGSAAKRLSWNEEKNHFLDPKKNSPRNSEDMWVFPKIGVLQNGWWK